MLGSSFFRTPSAPLLDHWTIDSALDDVPAAINEVLEAYFDHSAAEFADIAPEFKEAMSVLRNFVINGGKRVRPTFAWAGFRAGLSASNREQPTGQASSLADDRAAKRVISALAALEFVQACALIHDDIIDQSDTRRGQPTVHRIFEARHRDSGWIGSSEHYGVSQSILTGDLALSWADDLLNGAGLDEIDPIILCRVHAPWRAMRTEVIAGQQLDITMENNGSEAISDAMKVIRFKTASYTVSRPLHIGAAMAGADQATVDLLLEYGQLVGAAFQLRDDQLGVFGDPAVTGKPSGDDLRTGKRTALINRALAAEDGHAADIAELRSLLGPRKSGAEHSATDIDRMREIIRVTGAASYVENQITDFSDRAISMVENSWLGADIRDELVTYARALSERRF